ncbi:LytR/AlgR family response regulator transcription factor [Aneurinibacillus terranovensis]|uniref:LytR/AlgR family response regulator transcription factor n=1 Tax=Aneurinibacillus terranovensis TaxID=278991 RepID=UPI000419F5DF|nr:LytTR family DNA-binding domain-containing protein [Aneurinibacillus terranovensis]
MIRVLIVDDEAPARSELRFLLEQYDDLQIVGEADSGEETVQLTSRLQPDVIFLDINLHDGNGIDIGFHLGKVVPPPIIVYATAYENYGIQAFETEAVDYILKPFSKDRLERTIHRIRKQTALKNEEKITAASLESTLKKLLTDIEAPRSSHARLPVDNGTSIAFIDTDTIIYAAAEERSSRVYTNASSYLTSFCLQELEKKLPPNFFRIHRTYIANLNCVNEFIPWFKGSVQVKMNDKNETVLPVSRNLVREVKTRLGF